MEPHETSPSSCSAPVALAAALALVARRRSARAARWPAAAPGPTATRRARATSSSAATRRRERSRSSSRRARSAPNLQRYGLGSPTAVIRMLVQQSNCFQVVERGVAMGNMMQERALGAARRAAARPEHRQGPDGRRRLHRHAVGRVQREQRRRHGRRARRPARRRARGAALGAIAGGLKFKQAETSMLLVDSRSGIQVAAAQGSAEKADFAVGGALLGGVAGGRRRLQQHQRRQDDRRLVHGQLEQHRPEHPQQPLAGAGARRRRLAAERGGEREGQAGAAGDVMVPKIAGVKVLRQPRDGGGDCRR